MCLFCAAAMTPVGGGHRRVRTREAICTYKTHIWAVHSRALVPLIPQAPAPTRGEGGVWASSSPKRDRERRRLPRTCPCKARTSRPRGASRARCPRSQCGRDARDPRRGRMPALPGGQDARAPRRGGMPASLACGRDARAPRWGRMPALPGMRARRPRSQAVQGHERFQRVRNTVFESLFRSRPRRRASPHAPRTRGVGG